MENVYNAPQSDIETVGTKKFEFYAVSPLKFTVLFLSTLGIYQIYWNYKNWRLIKTQHNLKIWPVGRSIFSIFFITSLLKRVDSRLVEAKLNHQWRPVLIANVYIIFSVAGSVCDRLADKEIGVPFTLFVSTLILPVVWFYLHKAQLAINLALGDPAGESNARFTAANIFWIVLGVLLWLMAGLGLMEALGFINLEG